MTDFLLPAVAILFSSQIAVLSLMATKIVMVWYNQDVDVAKFMQSLTSNLIRKQKAEVKHINGIETVNRDELVKQINMKKQAREQAMQRQTGMSTHRTGTHMAGTATQVHSSNETSLAASSSTGMGPRAHSIAESGLSEFEEDDAPPPGSVKSSAVAPV